MHDSLGERGIVVEEVDHKDDPSASDTKFTALVSFKATDEEVTGKCFATLLTSMDTFLNFLGGSLISFGFIIITLSLFL